MCYVINNNVVVLYAYNGPELINNKILGTNTFLNCIRKPKV